MLSSSLKSALSGINLSQQKIGVISNNISNANTDGYTRKTVTQTSQQAAGLGLGVEIQSIERQVNENLTKQVRDSYSDFQSLIDKNEFMRDIQNYIGSPKDNFNFASLINKLTQEIETVGSDPDIIASRQVFTTNALNLTENLSQLANNIQTMRSEADTRISNVLNEINDELELILDLNGAIQEQANNPTASNNLLDQRDEALRRLAGMIDITITNNTDGTVSVQTKSGKTLLDSSAKTLSHTPASSLFFDDSFVATDPQSTDSGFGGIEGIFVGTASTQNDITNDIVGGRLKGLIDLRDTMLPQLAADIEKLSVTLKNQVNIAHNQGTSNTIVNDLTGTRIFNDTSADSFTTSGTTRFALINTDGTYNAFVDIAAGSYTADSLRDAINAGLSTSVASTTNGNLELSHATLGIAIVDLNTDTTPQNITFDSDTYSGLSYFLGLNDFFVDTTNSSNASTVSQTMTVRSDILANNNKMAHGTLNDVASPTLSTTKAVAIADNSTISKIAQTLNQSHSVPNGLVFKSASGSSPAFTRTLTGELPSLSLTLSQFASSIITKNAQNFNDLSRQETFKQTLYENTHTAAKSDSGVNLDEEMAEMIVVQQSFSASARVINVTSDLFDVLMGIV